MKNQISEGSKTLSEEAEILFELISQEEISEEDYEEIEYLLSQKNSLIFERNDVNNLPLHVACKKCDLRLAQILLEKDLEKTTVNQRGRDDITPLYYTCVAKDFDSKTKLDLAELLLNNGADPHLENPHNKFTPYSAAKKRNENIGKLIEERDLGLGGKNAGCVAVADEENNLEQEKAVSKKPKKKKNKPKAAVESEEFKAEQIKLEGQNQIVEMAKAMGVSINFFDSNQKFNPNATDASGNSIIHQCCRSDERCQTFLRPAMTFLTAVEADINLKNKEGMTPFLVAARSSSIASAKFLMENPKTNLHETDIYGNGAVHYLSVHGSEESFEILQRITEGQDLISLNRKNKSNLIPASLCCGKGGNYRFLEKFLDAGVNCNYQLNESGDTLLHYACITGNTDAALLLIARGADYTLKNKSGLTPIKMMPTSSPEFSRVRDAIGEMIKGKLPSTTPETSSNSVSSLKNVQSDQER